MRARSVTPEEASAAAKKALQEVEELTQPIREEEVEEVEEVGEAVASVSIHSTPPVVPPVVDEPAEEDTTSATAHDMDDEDMMELFGVNTNDLTGVIASDDED
jgi:allophanate hydrolase subunit 1